VYWVIQSNIYEEENYDNLLATLARLTIPYSVHKVVPFVGTLESEPEIPDGSDVIVMGSYSLARYAVTRGWFPGAFTANLDFELQRKRWGNRMLNADAKIYEFAKIPFQYEPFFVRPVLDTKTYTGLVLDWGQYEERRDGLLRVIESGEIPFPGMLAAADATMVCTKKEIFSETRTWIIDGEVCTCSGYKLGTRKGYTSPERVDPRIVNFANECAQEWSPNRAYVLDVADTPDGLKIVEVNNLNSAGWYRCDMQRLVMALESMDLS
jgi:hypothetical protein